MFHNFGTFLLTHRGEYPRLRPVSRASILSEEVRALQKALVALFLRSGSVNGLCGSLNDLLTTQGITQKIYPNRLHTLLSSEVSRGVNAKTLELVQKAVALSDWEKQSAESEAIATITADLQQRWNSSSKSLPDIQRLSLELSVPATVVEYLLQRAGLLGGDITGMAEGPDGLVVKTFKPGRRRPDELPDYGFQDVAVKQCRSALHKGVGRRVGLVSPTGSGKTEIAIRIALQELHESPSKTTKVFWVTHRKNLRKQAHQRLQKMLLKGLEGIPEEASSLLAERCEFIMVREAHDRFLKEAGNVELVIVDEAHHAAAGSYDPIFESLPPLSVLALTATPNRTDGLPIRIDEIGFTITFAELVERNVILMPEFVQFPVSRFDWNKQAIEDLADHLISETVDKYRKVLVIAPQIERVEEFHNALLNRWHEEKSHPLDADDIGFVHSQGNSANEDSQTFIDEFSNKPRGILVSAQMLLEGFDDPQIDTVVITYPTSSLITLMQAAGRCVRRAPGKQAAYVIQARDDRASYYFEQRWLYQDISDFARPHLEDIAYRNHEELAAKLRAVLTAHNVSAPNTTEILEQFKNLKPGEKCQLLLAGLPYFGAPTEFASKGKWTGALLTSETRGPLTTAFNEFCARGHTATHVRHYGPIVDDLARRLAIGRLTCTDSLLRFLPNLFISTQNAVREVYEQDQSNYDQGGRPKPDNHSTSWLRYITFEFRPSVPEVVSNFLAECVNRSEVGAKIEEGADVALLLRVPLPLAGYEAFALTTLHSQAFYALRDGLLAVLQSATGLQQLTAAAAFLASHDLPEIPHRLYAWMHLFSRQDFMSANSLPLGTTQTNDQPPLDTSI